MSQNKRNCEGAIPAQDEKEENSMEAPNEYEKLSKSKKSGFRRSKSCESLRLTESYEEEQKSKKPSFLKNLFSCIPRKSKSVNNLLSNNENQEQNLKFKEDIKMSKIKKMKVNDVFAPPDTEDEEIIDMSTSLSGVQIHQAKSKGHENASFEHENEDEEKAYRLVSFYTFREEPIGCGGGGTCVYSGVNTKDGREVAIKKIYCHTRKQSSQYKKEIEYLLRLRRCENVVNYLDVEVEKDVVYIILELMEGTLETLVDRPDIKITINFTELCRDIISALDYLHNKSVIHRDIKPKNILFVSNPRLMLKLADFGLSKVLDSDSSSIGYNGGTRCWIAPEVLKSLDQFSTASDVFAAGLVLHYLMTSRNPFAPTDVTMNRKNCLLVEHRTIGNILKQKMNLDECLSPETLHLIDQMVSHDKDQRPTAGQVLGHPFFWPDKKKIKFLEATANQPETYQNEPSDFKRDIELTQLANQCQRVPWSEQSHAMVYVYKEMMKARIRSYDTASVADLLRFIRNAYQHVSEQGRTPLFQTFMLQDFVFLKDFKSLVLTVYETVRRHEWHKNKPEVQYAVSF